MKGGSAKRLVDFIKSFGQKLQNYSSYKTLDDSREILKRIGK